MRDRPAHRVSASSLRAAWRESPAVRSAMRRSKAWVSKPSSIASATVVQQRRRQQALHHRQHPGDVGVAAAEVAVVVDVAEEELRGRAALGIAQEAVETRLQPLRLPAPHLGQPAQAVARFACAGRAGPDGVPAGSQAVGEGRSSWTFAGTMIGSPRRRQPRRHSLERACSGNRPGHAADPLHSGDLATPPPCCHSTPPGNGRARLPRRPPRASAWPSPAAARSAACTNWARCARSTKRIEGLDLTRLDCYVGVSSGAFLAAGLANRHGHGGDVPDLHHRRQRRRAVPAGDVHAPGRSSNTCAAPPACRAWRRDWWRELLFRARARHAALPT